MPQDDGERRELQRLRDKFLEIMRRENDAALFDEEAQRRIGEGISRSTRQRDSDSSSAAMFVKVRLGTRRAAAWQVRPQQRRDRSAVIGRPSLRTRG